MIEDKLIILCDEIRTGKTTAINDALQSLRPCMGFLCPDIGGVRKLVDLSNMNIHEFQIQKPIYSNDIKVGRFAFLGSTFKLAQKILNDVPSDFEGHVIVDEIGRLELKDSGLEPALSGFLARRKQLKSSLILVIRDYLLEDAIEKYGLKDAVIMKPERFRTHFKSMRDHG